MTEYEKSFLANRALDAHEWRGVVELSNALHEFEPINKRGLGMVVVERLLCLGLAEKGRCSDRDASTGAPFGYRLSDLGWRVKKRGLWP